MIMLLLKVFFKTLKTELIYLKEGGYKLRVKTEREIFEYIECFYNSKRLHSSLGYNILNPN